MSIIIGKVISLYVKPEIFGQYSLFLVGVNLISALLIYPAIQSFNYSLQHDSSSVVVPFYFSLFAGIHLTLLPIMLMLVAIGGIDLGIGLLLVCLSLTQALSGLVINYLNINALHVKYVITQSILSISHLLLLLAAIGLDFISSWILLLVLGLTHLFAIIYGGGQIVYNEKVKVYFDKGFLYSKQLIKLGWDYSRPLILLAIFTWTVNYSDRWLIKVFLSEEEVGLYHAGYGLGSKFFLVFVAPFLMYIRPIVFSLKKNNRPAKDSLTTIRKYLSFYILLGIIILTVIHYCNDWIGHLFLSAIYEAGFPVIFITAMGYLALTSLQFMELVFYAYGTTQYALYHYIIGAGINITSNLLLIPRFGFIGSAYATVLSFGIQFLVVLFFYLKLINRKVDT